MKKLDFRAYDKQSEIIIDHAQNGYTIFYPTYSEKANMRA